MCAARAASGLLPTQAPDGSDHPQRIGPYQILRVLGEGGFGVVYLAIDPGTGGQVALKRSKHLLQDARAQLAFRREVTLYEQLGSLPHVVGIRTAGEEHGHAYFTMPVMEGGSLRSRMEEFRAPREAARLLVGIARAVDSIHRATPPVLHRDLKPENILFDREGRPHITDFGIAKVGTDAGWTRDTLGVGCPYYTAPEQAFPENGDLTPAADVYSLGAIFYELLTGSVPFRGRTADEVLRRIVSEDPVSPKELVPELDRDWETICLFALKRANVRYPSAKLFADDLENALTHRPLLARRSSAFDRIRRFSQRHPGAAIGGGVGLLALSVLVSSQVAARQTELRDAALARAAELERQQVARETRDRRRRHSASMMQFTASAQAGALLFQLGKSAARVREAVQDPELVALAQRQNLSPADPALRRHLGDFDSLLILDVTGNPRVHSRSVDKPYFERNFAFREYFQIARDLVALCPGAVSLAPAFRSEEDEKIKFPLAAPMLDSEGRWVGVLMAATVAAPAFGDVQLQDPEGGQLAALLGPRGLNRNEPPGETDLTYLVHPHLAGVVEYQLGEPTRSALRRHLAPDVDPCRQFELLRTAPLTSLDYRDPIPGFEGRWHAAFAPVGRTGYFVVVQSRPEADEPLVSPR